MGYEQHDHLTRELLDSVQVGDLIKCNDWKVPLRVMGVSDNYFVMARKAFGKVQYSVCDKEPCSHSRNNYTKGSFRIGRDDYVFGSSNGYEWESGESNVSEYLDEFEIKKCGLSVRSAVDLNRLSIKKLRPTA